jgi:hypothetical protein
MKPSPMDLESAKAAAKRLFQKVNFTGGPLQSYEISSLLTDTYEYLKTRNRLTTQPTNPTRRISRCTPRCSTPTEMDRSLWRISKAKPSNTSADPESSKTLPDICSPSPLSTALAECLVGLMGTARSKAPSIPRRTCPSAMATINNLSHLRTYLTSRHRQATLSNPNNPHNATTTITPCTTSPSPNKYSKDTPQNTAPLHKSECQAS